MTKADLIALAKQAAEKYGLESALACALAEQESAWNPWACRYEPAFYQKYVTPMLEVGHIGTTEATSRATSYGLFQLMGQTARELGFGGPFLTELCDPEINSDYGCKFMSVLYSKTGNNTREALLRWNGGNNEAYPDQVMSRMPTYA